VRRRLFSFSSSIFSEVSHYSVVDIVGEPLDQQVSLGQPYHMSRLDLETAQDNRRAGPGGGILINLWGWRCDFAKRKIHHELEAAQ
jgi:hypothetical protein